jgi:hypothetical protein
MDQISANLLVDDPTMMRAPGKTLPDILYCGDIRVDATMAGNAVLYRLFEQLPASNLRIVESSLFPSTVARRLPEVSYLELPYDLMRLARSRLWPWVAEWWQVGAGRRARHVIQSLGEWRPQAVVSVTHTVSWTMAARIASQLRVPLHLINHDDCLNSLGMPARHFPRWKRRLRRVYRQAATRACVSPYMAEMYEEDFGVAGDVLYPTWSKSNPRFTEPAAALSPGTRPVFAFAGSIYSRWYLERLTALADALVERGGVLWVYSRLSQEFSDILRRHSNIQVFEPIPSGELLRRLRAEAHVLYLPMSFWPAMRREMIMSFPSKLVDYCGAGLPILIQGPEYGSSVRFALEHPGIARVVATEELDALRTAVRELTDTSRAGAEYREKLAHGALQAGERYFSPDTNFRHFVTMITGSQKR